MKESSLKFSQFYNSDEPGLLWWALPEDTLASWGEKKVLHWKIGKEWVPALLCANAVWSHMLKPVIVGKWWHSQTIKDIML
jgi:hypothetical protein